MASARKYQEGDVIATVEEAVRRIMAGEYLFCRGKPLHPAWISHQSLELIAATVKRGDFRAAVKTNEEDVS